MKHKAPMYYEPIPYVLIPEDILYCDYGDVGNGNHNKKDPLITMAAKELQKTVSQWLMRNMHSV